MPKSLHGKKLTSNEHSIWQNTYKSQVNRGLSHDRAAASATEAVKKSRKKKK